MRNLATRTTATSSSTVCCPPAAFRKTDCSEWSCSTPSSKTWILTDRLSSNWSTRRSKTFPKMECSSWSCSMPGSRTRRQGDCCLSLSVSWNCSTRSSKATRRIEPDTSWTAFQAVRSPADSIERTRRRSRVFPKPLCRLKRWCCSHRSFHLPAPDPRLLPLRHPAEARPWPLPSSQSLDPGPASAPVAGRRRRQVSRWVQGRQPDRRRSFRRRPHRRQPNRLRRNCRHRSGCRPTAARRGPSRPRLRAWRQWIGGASFRRFRRPRPAAMSL